MSEKFIYNFQMAGYPFDKYDEMGTVDYKKFVQEFRSFPWMTQLGKSNGGSEATISVKNSINGTDYWVSIMGSPAEYTYIVGIIFPKEVKTLFGFGKSKTIRWLEMFIALDGSTVESTFEIFFEGNIDKLKQELSELQKFGEMEAQN